MSERGHPVTIPVTVNVTLSLDAPMAALVRMLARDGLTMRDVVAVAVAEDPRCAERMGDAVAGALVAYVAKRPEARA